MASIPLPPYAPDLDDIGLPVSALVSGVVPKGDGYGPFKLIELLTEALPAPCRGYFTARRSDGSIALFAGTLNELYLLDNGSLTWENVSKGGGPYADLATTDNWDFDQYNDVVIATQIGTVPQAYTLSGGGDFADLGGSPPACKFVAVINRIVVLTGISSQPRRVQWCDFDAITTWTAGVGLADFQDLPTGGSVLSICGGDAYGHVFQEANIRAFIFAPGSPYTFEITVIGEGEVLLGQYTPIALANRTFYVAASGFRMLEGPRGVPVPIGKDMVDATFLADIDQGALRLLHSAIDPQATRVYFAYKSIAGEADLFDKVLSYDWAAPMPRKWTLLPISGQMLGSLSKPGLTLENLDPIAPTALTVLGAANNGAGLIRLTLDAVANPDFAIAGQNWIQVYGVVGTVEANGTWAVNIIDPTHIDLIGSTFVNAYVSGGKIGGSLDALPFSLDSVSVAARAALSIVDPSNTVGFFDGPNMEAIVETGEQDEERMVFVESLRVGTDCYNAMLSLGWRNRAQDAVAYTDEVAMDVTGRHCLELEARFIKARIRLPAASTWGYIKNVQPKAIPAGEN